MSATVEVCLSIHLEADAQDNASITNDAEIVFDKFGIYISASTVSDALSGVEDILKDALRACEKRAGVVS
jgi:hypothetical protein